MAADDLVASKVVNACHKMKISIPKQLVLVGVHNDEARCNGVSPSLSVNAAALALGISRRLLEIRFREIIGCGVNAFIVDRRLDHYRKPLLASKQSASSVARACGFSDMPYLTRISKTKFNCTPGSLLGSASAKVTRPN